MKEYDYGCYINQSEFRKGLTCLSVAKLFIRQFSLREMPVHRLVTELDNNYFFMFWTGLKIPNGCSGRGFNLMIRNTIKKI